MAKYYMSPMANVYRLEELSAGNDQVYGPVVVIPEGDWRRMVELATRYFPTCKCDGDCQDCREDAEIKAIIERTEAANG